MKKAFFFKHMKGVFNKNKTARYIKPHVFVINTSPVVQT